MNKINTNSSKFIVFRHVLLMTLCLLSACVSQPERRSSKHSGVLINPDLRCLDAARYANTVVGDGHCVSLIKRCAGAPDTSLWRPGEKVLSSKLTSGTIIATFKNGRYPSKHGYHAAIYISHDQHGIWVWDQWRGKPVHKRLIRTRHDGADAGNTAQAYRVVKLVRP